MDKCKTTNDDQCWEWTGTTNNAWYPLFSYHGKMISALKVLYRMYHKRRIPKNWVISHTCDNPSCMNPDHIYITSRSQLINELFASGRMKGVSQKETENPNAKLTEAEVKDIRQRRKDGATLIELAEEYGVGKTTIWLISHGRLWSHVD